MIIINFTFFSPFFGIVKNHPFIDGNKRKGFVLDANFSHL
ncbi:Fic family protein, partial [Acetobacter tropicalis]